MRKGLLLTIIFFSITVYLLGCSKNSDLEASTVQGENEKDVVKIGVIEPLSGQYEEYGQIEKKAIELAHAKYGEVLGKEIQLIIADNKSDLLETKKVTEDLIQEGVIAILGSYGDILSMGAGDVCEDSNIPIIGMYCENPLITKGNSVNFRVNPTFLLQSKIMTRYSYNSGHKKVAIIVDESNNGLMSMGQEFLQNFNELAKTEKDRSAIQLSYSDPNEMAGIIEKLSQNKVNSIYLLATYEDAPDIIRAIREAEINVPIMGNSYWNPDEILQHLGQIAEGLILCSFENDAIDLTETIKALEKDYHAKYGEEAAFNDQVMYAYDAYILLLDAINRAHSFEGEAIIQALMDTNNLVLNTGIISMDKEGDVIKPAIIKTVKNGQWIKGTTIDLSQNL
ncbi:MAG: ABC transporter substrate-binding protein [Peptostreptococcales bacterium]